jgi:hypothetical protein
MMAVAAAAWHLECAHLASAWLQVWKPLVRHRRAVTHYAFKTMAFTQSKHRQGRLIERMYNPIDSLYSIL